MQSVHVHDMDKLYTHYWNRSKHPIPKKEFFEEMTSCLYHALGYYAKGEFVLAGTEFSCGTHMLVVPCKNGNIMTYFVDDKETVEKIVEHCGGSKSPKDIADPIELF